MQYFIKYYKNRGYLSLLLERIPLTSKNKALKVLRVCRKYDLIEQGEGTTSYMPTETLVYKLCVCVSFPCHHFSSDHL